MSGVEAAGIVLGAIPLVVSSLENYIKGVATIKRYFRYKNELKSLLRALTTEYDIFRNTCEELLEGLVQQQEMVLLLQDPGGDLWRDPEIERKLKHRLQRAYSGYLETVNDMELVVEEFKKRLKLKDGRVRDIHSVETLRSVSTADSKGAYQLTMVYIQVQFDGVSTFKQECERLKFSLTKSAYEDLMDKIRRDNQTLSKLTKQSLSLEVSRARRYRRIPDFKGVRDYAKSVYATLRSCGCQGSHTANLRLESRADDVESDTDDDELAVKQLRFHMVFSYYRARSPASTSAACAWEEAEIRLLKDQSRSVPNEPALVSLPKKKAVQFHDQVQVAVKKAIDKHPDLEPIKDLCKAIQKLQQPQRDQCLGFLMDEFTRQKHGIFPPKKPLIDRDKLSIIPLQKLIPQQPSIQRRFTRGDKLRLAVILASSVLQLHGTPWMEENFGKDDIMFIHNPDGPLYGQPFIAKSFMENRTSSNPKISNHVTTYGPVRNPILFALGVLLIELCFGKPLEDLKCPNEKTSDDSSNLTLDWIAADRLVEDVYLESGSRYGDAVRHCIRCDFDRRGASLEDETFQQTVYEGVVSLLEDDLKQFHDL